MPNRINPPAFTTALFYHICYSLMELEEYLQRCNAPGLEDNERAQLQQWEQQNKPIIVLKFEAGAIQFTNIVPEQQPSRVVTPSSSSGWIDTHGNYHSSGSCETSGPQGH